MADLISHPFRLNQNGTIATRDDATDEYMAERIALIMSVRPGERVTVPMFGMEDPAFSQLALPALQTQADIFGIPVRIVDVKTVLVSDARVEYTIEFEREEVEENG